MTVCGLDYDQIPGLDPLAGRIDINPFPGVFETNLKQILVLFLTYSMKPVVVFQLAASLTVVAVIFTCLLIL